MNERTSPSRPAAGEVRLSHLLQVVSVGWLPVFGYRIGVLLRSDLTFRSLAIVVAIALFVATYLVVTYQSAPFGFFLRARTTAAGVTTAKGEDASFARWLPIGIALAITVALNLSDRAQWLDLIIFSCVAIAFRLRFREVLWTLPATALLAIGLGIATHASAQDVGQACMIGLSVGVGVASVIYALATARDLRVARGELARLAVAEERLRFARDLHDLLGHSLSLIALKSELAGQLAGQAPDRAVAEMRDVESVARTALREVREAVAGYRQPTLASELAAAVEILAAAGISFSWEGDSGNLPPRIEAALAWPVTSIRSRSR